MSMLSRALVAIIAVCASTAAMAQSSTNSRRDPVSTALASVDRSAGWCFDATTTAANAWEAAELPTSMGPSAAGLANRAKVRFIMLRVIDATDAAVPVCVRLGPNVDATDAIEALTCVGTAGSEATNGSFLRVTTDGRSWTHEFMPATSSPQIYVKSSAAGTGAGVRVCAEVSWHD